MSLKQFPNLGKKTPIILFLVCLFFQSILPLQASSASPQLALSPDKGSIVGNNRIDITNYGASFKDKEHLSVSSGEDHTLAVNSNGKLYSWGGNNNGQLGNGTTTQSGVPIEVDMSGVLADKEIKAIEAGRLFSLALDSDGKIYGWGYNYYGQLGNGTNAVSTAPTKTLDTGALAGRKIVQISAGYYHTLALDSEGQVYAWGNNNQGQLGNGTNTRSNAPVKISAGNIPAGRKIVQVSAGREHSFALDDAGQVYSWGTNNRGQLGDGTNNNSNIPVKVSSPQNMTDVKVSKISSGADHCLAIDSNGQIYAWGKNQYGQLGNASTNDSNIPVIINDSGDFVNKNITYLAAGHNHSFAVGLDGDVFSWGNNFFGQLGNGTTIERHTPSRIEANLGATITQITSFYQHSAVLTADGHIHTWGWNTQSQIGNNTTTNTLSPIQVNFSSLLNRDITSITFDGVEALSFNVVDGKTIEVVTPPHQPGKVDVVITADDGKTWTLSKGYEYIDNSSPEQPAVEVPEEEIRVPSTGSRI